MNASSQQLILPADVNLVGQEASISSSNGNESSSFDDDGLANNPERDVTFLSPLASMPKIRKMQCVDEEHKSAIEILEQLKEKFRNSTSHSEKVLLLTLAPKS